MISVIDTAGGIRYDLTALNGTAVDTNSGNKSAGTLRVVLATDQPALSTAMPVSAASLPLPAGAATAAKQPAVGTAGSAAADVLSIQGIASMTPIKVDGSAVTQPVSGSVSVSGTVDTELTTANLNTGAGTDTRAVVGLVYAASGGAVLVSAANPLPVTFSGTVTCDTELPAAAALADSTANPTVPAVGAFGCTFDGTNWNRRRQVANAQDTAGNGVAAAGLLAQLDDTSPSTVTENQFGPLRMGAKRSLHTQLRDAAGNDRGANVNASNQLSVSVDNTAGVNVAQVGAATVLTGNGTAGSGAIRVCVASDNTAFSVDTELPAALALTDSLSNPTSPLAGACSLLFNHNNGLFERERSNSDLSALASAARTATTSSADQTNYTSRGVIVWLDITVASGTGGLLVVLQGKDPVSGNYTNLNPTATAITATGTYGYELYPGSSAAAAGVGAGYVNQRTAGALPRTWRIQIFHNNATSYTYSVGFSLIR